jgi:hypothetical protein
MVRYKKQRADKPAECERFVGESNGFVSEMRFSINILRAREGHGNISTYSGSLALLVLRMPSEKG